MSAWNEKVRLDQIGRGVTRHLVADDAERRALAEDLDLASLERLEADVALEPRDNGWRLSGRVQADLVQTCGVTLEPLPSTIDSRFSVDLTDQEPPAPEDGIEYDLSSEDPPDVITDGAVDLAAYVIEHLTLEIDPFPRKPGAEFEAPDGPAEPSPFAVLGKLKTEAPKD